MQQDSEIGRDVLDVGGVGAVVGQQVGGFGGIGAQIVELPLGPRRRDERGHGHPRRAFLDVPGQIQQRPRRVILDVAVVLGADRANRIE